MCDGSVPTDLRHGIRLLARAPGFTLITLIALAAGIGANATVVSVANALLVRPLSVQEPSRVVRLFAGRYSATPITDIFEYARATRTLEGLVDGVIMVYQNNIGPGHFDTLRRPFLAGRDFTRRDTDQTAPVVIVNETLAHAMWPGEHAPATVGKRLWWHNRNARPGDAPPPWYEVAGVVRNSKYVTVCEDRGRSCSSRSNSGTIRAARAR